MDQVSSEIQLIQFESIDPLYPTEPGMATFQLEATHAVYSCNTSRSVYQKSQNTLKP
jgi:hypothetical protein